MKDTEAKSIARSLESIVRILGQINDRQEIEHGRQETQDVPNHRAPDADTGQARQDRGDDRELGLIDEDDAGWTRINPEEPIDPLTEFS